MRDRCLLPLKKGQGLKACSQLPCSAETKHLKLYQLIGMLLSLKLLVGVTPCDGARAFASFAYRPSMDPMNIQPTTNKQHHAVYNTILNYPKHFESHHQIGGGLERR